MPIPLSLEIFELGPLETNCYIIKNDDQCWVVDPGGCPESLLHYFSKAGLRPTQILLTHGHGDHIGGVADLMSNFPDCKLVCPEADAFMLSDPVANLSMMLGLNITTPTPTATCQGGETLDFKGPEVRILDTSGHTPGGVSFYLPSISSVITGDSLFAEGIGRTDLPGANTDQLISNIRTNLLSLPDETAVFPGHGSDSTVGHEKMYNPYVR